ncbi:MAG: hypothetical protein AAGM38_04570 [Pseudomonadota bacterium]
MSAAAATAARFGLTLAPCAPEDPAACAAPCGVAVSREALAARLDAVAARAARYPGLRAGLTDDLALFWAPDPIDLPWFETASFYIAPPRRRIFTPIGWRVATPELLLAPLLEALEARFAIAPPLLIVPPALAAGAGAARVIDLRESALAPSIDWAALAADRAARAPEGGPRRRAAR